MTEIKTADQYVLARLLAAEAEVRDLRAQNEELRKALDALAPYFHIRTNWRGDVKYIWFDGPAKNYNPQFFDELVKLFGLTEKEDA